MRPWTMAIALTFAACTSSAWADPRCMVHMLKDVAADEAPEQVRSASNSSFGPVTRVLVSKATGRMSFCAATSYCYNSNAFEFVTPCRLKIDKEKSTSRQFLYSTR